MANANESPHEVDKAALEWFRENFLPAGPGIASRRQSPQKVDKAAVGRIRENLYPHDRRRGEKYPGEVVDRLDKAGFRRGSVGALLYNYAVGSEANEPRRQRRERGRVALALLRHRAQDAQVRARWFRLHGWTALAEAADQEKQYAEGVIKHIKKAGVYSLRRAGLSPLEYLILLQEGAKRVGRPLTQGELSDLVWAALSALRAKAKPIEADSLARNLARFRKRNPDLVQAAERHVAKWLHNAPSPLA